jgi:medium-chain acyl-[acyl-carrier-protein] hydrolase
MADPPTSVWIARPRPQPAPRMRLFCAPHAGSGSAQFWPWAQLLPADVEVCPFQLPGREGRFREPAATALTQLADALAGALDGWLTVPFALFGRSMGALICFEVARRIRRDGGPTPSYLFASGRPAPHVATQDPPMHALPDAALIEAVRHRYGELPDALSRDPELLAHFLPIIRADLALVETYDYRPELPLECPVAAFGGRDDSHVSREALAGWRAHTTADFTLTIVPGDHFFHISSRMQLTRELAAFIKYVRNTQTVRFGCEYLLSSRDAERRCGEVKGENAGMDD